MNHKILHMFFSGSTCFENGGNKKISNNTEELQERQGVQFYQHFNMVVTQLTRT